MNAKKLNRILSFLLSAVLSTSAIVGCSKSVENVDVSVRTPEIDSEIIVEEIVDNIQKEIDSDNNEKPSAEYVETMAESLVMSEKWDDYVGDVETFVYGLISNELSYSYDVFSAYVELPDKTEVYGIGYTNYESCFTNDDDSLAFFESGFVPFYGEIPIPQDAFDDGLILHNMEYEDDDTTFILSYESSPFENHCVVYNQYIKYGVNNQGVINIEAVPYEKGKCDEELGTLYSFDEKKNLFDTEVGNCILLNGESLSSQIDYDQLEKEINYVLETQDSNFLDVDVNTYAFQSQEAIVDYLRNMQEETFLGYRVSELTRVAEAMNPLDCIQVNSDGIGVVNLEEAPKEGEEAIVKWLVGTGCVILTAVGIVGSMVFIEVPPLSSASGAITGTAIEIFMEVVVSNEKLVDINWGKVALASATGAISGFLAPYIWASTGGAGATYYLADSSIDGLLAGIEQSVAAFMDGERGIEIARQFGKGTALGFALSGAFKGAAKVAGKVLKKVAPAVSKAGGKLLKSVTGKTSKAQTSGFSKLISKLRMAPGKLGKPLTALKKSADGSVLHSEYVSKKIAERIKLEKASELLSVSLNSLRKSDIVDKNGKIISKEVIKELAQTAQDNELLGYFLVGGEFVEIKKMNSVVGVFFDSSKYQSVNLPKGLVSDRQLNFEEAAKLFKKDWISDPSEIPDPIAKKIEESGKALADIEPRKLVELIQNSEMVLHENIDLKSITLVARTVHDKANEMGVGHFGGYGLAKHLKEYMAEKYYDRFLSALSTDLVLMQNN